MTVHYNRGRFRRLFSLIPSALSLALATLISGVYLGGCTEGGTSSGGGNPDLTLQIQGSKQSDPFHGFLQFFVQGGDPVFFTPLPDDGFTSPQVILGGEQISTLFLKPGNSIHIKGEFLRELINANPMHPLFKTSGNTSTSHLPVQPPKFPRFNIILIGSDSTAGLLQDVHLDTNTGKLRYADGSGGDTLFIDLAADKEYAGIVDTTGLQNKAIGLYVPGTPYYAEVQGDSFHFAGMPSGKLQLRMITSAGWIHAMPDSLGKALPTKLKVGKRLDSLTMPKPNPVLAPPIPNPLGNFAFTDSVSITLKAESGATIYYTLDGSTPGINSKQFTSPIILYASATLKSIAFKKGYNRSPISYNNYQLVPAAPTAMPASTVFHDSITVTLTKRNPSDEIFYAIDGKWPSKFSTKYTSPLKFKQTTELKAVSYSLGLGTSRTMEEKYILIANP